MSYDVLQEYREMMRCNRVFNHVRVVLNNAISPNLISKVIKSKRLLQLLKQLKRKLHNQRKRKLIGQKRRKLRTNKQIKRMKRVNMPIKNSKKNLKLILLQVLVRRAKRNRLVLIKSFNVQEFHLPLFHFSVIL